MNWIAEILRSKSVRVIVYLDDFLLASQDRAKLTSQIPEELNFLRSLGWQIKAQKCILEPCQEIEFLDLVWNTHLNLVRLPNDKVISISETLDRVIKDKSCTFQQLQSVLGSLNFACFAIHRGRLHCRYLQLFQREFRQGRQRERRSVQHRVMDELVWWKEALSTTTPLHKRPVTHYLTTDAADAGWGAQVNNIHTSGSWTARQRSWHSNKKELYAVYASLQEFPQELRNAHILVQSDNRTLVAYINKEGGTRSIELLDLTFHVLQLDDSMNVTLTAAYLPGRYNGIADRLSRKKPIPEWHLLIETRNKIFKKWGTPEIDLFASKRSMVVDRYVSLNPKDHRALFIDAFSKTWKFKLVWVFPPPSLIPRVLAHLNKCQGNYVIIAPMWNQTFWMSNLMNRSKEPPMEITDLNKVLIDLSTG
ncbi:uncharacterized protein LOC131675418 [Phymastichus coffea]|uniref:uncharacterized protein LOC131675418 n=1 Tax=Phymastichus coffea TaxID=108790 RepID=UPI00273C3862|nr:uncharacterized protein LOC131675418 [Phymastichus coffea]